MKKALLACLMMLVSCSSSRMAFRDEPKDPESTLSRVNPVAQAEPRHLIGKIVYNAYVDEDSVGAAILAINAANNANVEAIIFEINSPGGSVDDGFLLSKAIEESQAPVICVVDGMAASMGMYILESCQTRIMTTRSTLMAHQPAVGGRINGRSHEFQNIADFLRALSLSMAVHMSSRMNITLDEYLKRTEFGKEWWLVSDEALSVRAVDRVINSVREIEIELAFAP